MPFTLDTTSDRDDMLFALAPAPDGQTCFAGGSDFSIVRLRPDGAPGDGQPLRGHQSYVTGLAHAGGALWSVGYDRLLIRWNPGDHHPAAVIRAHDKWVRAVAASPDGRRLATVGDDMKARLWRVDTGGLERVLEGHAPLTPTGFSSMLYACAFSPDGRRVAAVDRVGQVIVWDTDTGREVARLDAGGMYTWDAVQRLRSIGGPRCLAFSPDGEKLFAGGMGHVQNVDGLGGKARIEAFDWERGERFWTFESETHKGLVETLQFLPGGAGLAAAGGAGKGFVITVDPASGRSLDEPESPMHIHAAVPLDHGRSLLTVGHHKTARWIWSATPPGGTAEDSASG